MVRNYAEYFKITAEEKQVIERDMKELGFTTKSEYYRFKILQKRYDIPHQKL